ncbi:DUF1295 domain-containing protein [Candidatus Saccharibacteria bacterium]|nr:DUF1295 domain-containing protein [Candidatus Saccharibacteria bacterium]
MVWQLLGINAAILFVWMSIWYVVAKERKQVNVVDVAWAGGFVLVGWASFMQYSYARTLLMAGLVTIWGIRLTAHLYKRVIVGRHEDPRYKELMKNWGKHIWTRAFWSVFMLQGLLVLIISLPLTMSATGTVVGRVWPIYAGMAIWVVGYLIEKAADAQLAEFVAKRKSDTQVMDRGLWHYSRHPNYFGEILQWWGIGVIALQAESGWIGLAGPLTLTILILFVSGIPPIERRKKSNPEYAAYMRRTSRLVPLPPKS